METIKINNTDFIRCVGILLPHKNTSSRLCMYHSGNKDELSVNTDILSVHTKHALFIVTSESGKWGEMGFEHHKEYECSNLRYPSETAGYSWSLREMSMNWQENDEYCKRVAGSSDYIKDYPRLSESFIKEYAEHWNAKNIPDMYVEYDVLNSCVKITDNQINVIFENKI